MKKIIDVNLTENQNAMAMGYLEMASINLGEAREVFIAEHEGEMITNEMVREKPQRKAQ